MKIITDSRVFLFLPQSEAFVFSRPDFPLLDVPDEPVLARFEAAMQKFEQNGELWRVDYLCINYTTFELALMQGLITIDHILTAIETENYIKIKYWVDSVGGCWEMRIVDEGEQQGIWGDARLIAPIY